ncbi:MAG: PAS domain S-box protein [Cyclobacteriaceae bacterium]
MEWKAQQSLLDTFDAGFCIANAHGEILFANKSLLQHAGLDKTAINDLKINDLVGSNGTDDVSKELFEHAMQGFPFVKNILFNSKTDVRSARVSAKIVDNSEFANRFLIRFDFTNSEQGIYDGNYDLYRILSENAYDINIILHKDRLTYISPSVHDFLGYPSVDFAALENWIDIVHPDDKTNFAEKVQRLNDGKVNEDSFECRIRHSNGQFRWFENKGRIEDQFKGGRMVILTSMDITQRVEAEEMLARQKEFVEIIFDSTPNLFHVKDAEGHIVYCNRAFADLVGHDKETIYEQGAALFTNLSNKSGNYAEMEQNVLSRNEELLIEEEIESKDGLINYYQTHKKPFFTKDGQAFLLSISTNVSKLKYYQKESQKALKARTDFFSVMSHEIRTPLNALMGMTELLIKRKPRKDQFKLLQTVHFSSRSLISLVNDVLDFSKIEAGKLELEMINLNLHELLDHIRLSHRPKAMAKKIDITFNISKDIPVIVKGDSIKISQIFNNLISNAIKFTERGGIELKAELQKETEDQLFIDFSVADSGIGIPTDKQDEIFKPFQQAAKSTSRLYGGTGLGLSIVKNLVELHEGTIEVESEVNVGTVFKIVLPLGKADQTKMEDMFAVSVKGVRWNMDIDVLYVEDVTTNQFLIEEILSEWGVRVEIASDGYEALRKIENRNYDLILMDIQMPGIDGYETSQRIRKKKGAYFKEVPIIALTASTSDEARDRMQKAGIEDYIFKPINIDLLRDKIAKSTGIELYPELDELIDAKADENDKNDLRVNFDETDKLFLENIVRYQDFLRKTIEEFEVNLEQVIAAIRQSDYNSIRQISHRMKSIIHTLRLFELDACMAEVKEKLKKSELLEGEKKELVKKARLQFDAVRDQFIHKLSSLKWMDFGTED